MEARKHAIIGGLYANPNLDDGEGTRENMIETLEDNFNKAVATMYGGDGESEESEFVEINPDNPFWAAMYRGLDQQREGVTEEDTKRAWDAEMKWHKGKKRPAPDGGEPYEIDQD